MEEKIKQGVRLSTNLPPPPRGHSETSRDIFGQHFEEVVFEWWHRWGKGANHVGIWGKRLQVEETANVTSYVVKCLVYLGNRKDPGWLEQSKQRRKWEMKLASWS